MSAHRELDASPVAVGQPRATRRPETARLYAAEWLAFVGWCRAARRSALPADADTLATFLLAVATGAARGTLGRKRAAICAMHRQHGLPLPALDASARAALRRAAASKPAGRNTASAATPSRTDLVRLATQCQRDMAGLRDRALLLLAASGQATVEDLLGLEREQVRFSEAGAELRLVRDLPATVVIARGHVTSCPVRALEDWLQASDTLYGPVFRKVDRWGNVEQPRLGPDGLRRIVARRLAARSNGR